MMVSIHPPDDSEFDFRTAMNIWGKLRKRHILVEKAKLCNQKWNVDINVSIFSIIFFVAYINLESEQNQFLNFIIIDQCYFMEFEN
jgi:hypothetical protein